jgi:hypothetical protein
MTSDRGIKTNHLPILTKLNLATSISEESAMHNFRDVNWETFNKVLGGLLSAVGPAVTINTQLQLNSACDKLTKALQDMISKVVPVSRICTKSKRWWMRELTLLRQQADKLGRKASKLSHLPYHYLHAEHDAAVKLYHSTLKSTKRQHWRDWLERAKDPDIWTVNKLINSQFSDRGRNRILALIYKEGNKERKASSNGEKGAVLARNFFLDRPPMSGQDDTTDHPS